MVGVFSNLCHYLEEMENVKSPDLKLKVGVNAAAKKTSDESMLSWFKDS